MIVLLSVLGSITGIMNSLWHLQGKSRHNTKLGSRKFHQRKNKKFMEAEFVAFKHTKK